jgi:hypothetical protein
MAGATSAAVASAMLASRKAFLLFTILSSFLTCRGLTPCVGSIPAGASVSQSLLPVCIRTHPVRTGRPIISLHTGSERQASAHAHGLSKVEGDRAQLCAIPFWKLVLSQLPS